MSLVKSPVNKPGKNRRVPNAFMIFVKEHKRQVLEKSNESYSMLVAFLGRKWRSMSVEEKQIYYSKYKALKMLKKEKPDSNSSLKEKVAENENNNKYDMNNLSINIYSKKEDVVTDKPTTDEPMKKIKSEYTSSSSIDKSSSQSDLKYKPLKKARRPANAFLIFAKEQRHNLDPSIRKDNMCHVNSVLGNMWQLLSNSEKAKYYDEARRRMNLYKKIETDPSRKLVKKKNKVELNPKKFVGRSCKTKKEFSPEIATNSLNREINSSEKKEFETKLKKSLDKAENTSSTSPLSQPLTVNEHPKSNSLPPYDNVLGHFYPLATSVEPHISSNPCSCGCGFSSDFNNNNRLQQNLTLDAGLQPGSFPPIFPSYSFISHHQTMVPRMFPFSSATFYPSPYLYYAPYSYNSVYNNAYAYTSSYMNGYSTRIIGPSSYAFYPNTPSTTTVADSREESNQATKRDENSGDEQLVIDEGDLKEEENGSA